MIGRAHHYGVTVSDLETSPTFYRDRPGMGVVDRLTEVAEAMDVYSEGVLECVDELEVEFARPRHDAGRNRGGPPEQGP